MYQKKFIKIIWFLLSFITTTFYNPVLNSAAGVAPFVNPAGPADIDFMNDPEFAKMLEEFERELANLSPEERQEFDNMVEEFARIIEQMPPEEFDQLLQDMSNDFVLADAANVAAEVAPREQIPAPVIQIAIPDEIKQLAETLQKIKTYLSVLLIKIQIAPELPLKINKWISQDKITNFPSAYTWDQCKHDIEKFLVLLSHLLLTDKKMNPIFLFEIHKDQSLEQMLISFADQLAVIPLIDIVEFGFKQERETNIQIQQVMSQIGEVLFKQDAMSKLELIFKTRQSEIDTKQLESLAKNKNEPAQYNFPSYAQPAGRQDFYDDERHYGNTSGDNNFYYDDYDQYYPSYSSGSRYGGSSGYGFGDEKEKPEGIKGGMGGKEKGKSKEEKPSEEKGKKSESEKEKKKDLKTIKKELQKILSEIVSLAQASNIEKFEQYLKNKELPFTAQNTLVNSEKMIQKLKEATQFASDLVKLLEEEKRPEKAIKEIEEKIASDVKDLQEFQQKITKLIAEKELYSLEKQFGYFEDEEALEQLKKQNARKAKEMEENQETFVSIAMLDKKLNKLLSTLKPFIKVATEEKEEELEQKEGDVPKVKEPEEKTGKTSNIPSSALGVSALVNTDSNNNTAIGATALGIATDQPTQETNQPTQEDTPTEENN